MTKLTLQDEVENYVRQKKIKKKDLAENIGISPVMLSHWLKGRTAFSKDVLQKLIVILDK